MTTATTSRPTDGSHLPVVHLNGSGKKALLAQYEAVRETLAAALDALYEAAPHGRDYYPNGEGAYLIARTEWERRVTLVRGAHDDIMADWLAVDAAS